MPVKQPIPISQVVIDRETQLAVTGVLQSGRLVMGAKVRQLEQVFTRLGDSRFAVGVTSGTAALHTALVIAGIGPGDEVITTPFTYIATSNAILLTGAKPVFVDIDPVTFNLNPQLVESAITPKTKAILPVDLYGLPANYRRLRPIARKHSLYLIEDSAQAIGALYYGKRAGSLGDIGCFSLYATKNLMAGEGGMLTLNSPRLALYARRFRNHGEAVGLHYDYRSPGVNYCLSEVMATIALGQAKDLNLRNRRRREIAVRYTQAFTGIRGLIPPSVPPHSESVFHQYTIRITEGFPLSRTDFQTRLFKAGITTRIYYPRSLHRFNHLNPRHLKYHLPEADRAAREVVSLPVHPYLTDHEVDYIIDTIIKLGHKS